MLLVGFILLAVALFYLQGLVFYRLALKDIQYDRNFKVAACYAGDQVELVERIANRKWFPVPWLRVESQLSTHLHFGKLDNFSVSKGQVYQNHKSLFSLKPYVQITRRHCLVAARRGVYRLQTVTMTSGDLLGVHIRHKQIPLTGELLVYPKPAEVALDQLPFHSLQGEHVVKRWIIHDPFLTAGVRKYEAGDTLRSINWKATARTGQLQVHKHDYTANRQLMIYLNIDDEEGMWRSVNNVDLIEQGISWAAGAAAASIEQGMEAGFSSNMQLNNQYSSTKIEPGSGYEHLLFIFEAMARLSLEKTEPFSYLLQAAAEDGYEGRDVLIISTFWNDELEEQAARIRSNGNSVTVWELAEDKSE
ncbi:DUF58 domain-containing protein [Paenibacillus sp. IITD108]|uniref:DUF58 domain-containing protein n=1 Tax=Paenibacillus sp. IITD108 TaxID=3116649 RepID=UPI002F3EA13A